ncbi:hypothetical protein SAMN05216249_11173 [Acetitomaculum ruminis DSM 5522]|uniref:Peptidase n=1 Tax=Acetitomaculum ruminis DSM 5522 TaxID=1120918 RepID=A0A1I0YXL9_9FIRM|nr:zinc metallopeptidase [Acetitomaculum ruminis]SFB16968.1 hypothetical protein SAMN05216249_11173 [Acetitomaculum ruminis DSM 5522]
MPYFGFYDWTYILVIIGALISMLASANVSRIFRKYSKIGSFKGITAQDAALMILRNSGINDVRIERIRGNLTDHYSPGEKVLRLSDSVYGSSSIAAIGVAAHECGHAIQHKVGYIPLSIRSISVPLANFGSKLSWPLIVAGLIFGFTGMARIGVILFLAVVLFQLVTLPVEFNASRRALRILSESNMLNEEEMYGARSVLFAAALTYVAALFTAILQLLRLIILVGRRD